MRVEELRKIAQAGKDVDPAWYRVHRRLSIHLTRGALALRIAPNHASIAMMVLGLAGSVLLASLDAKANLLGILLLYGAFLLDKVDGELARVLRVQSGHGVFLDRLYHRLVEPSMFIGVAVHEYRLTESLLPIVAGFATIALANVIEENQHLAAYIVYKRMREGARLPLVKSRAPSSAWSFMAGAFRPLKGFRMLIVALPLVLLYYVAQWITGLPIPTLGLLASAIALAIYLAFQCTYYYFERLDAEMTSITDTLQEATRTTRRSAMKRRTSRTMIVMLAFLLGLSTFDSARAAGPYYVRNTGGPCSDSGNGSLALPYCSIMAALQAHHEPGAVIKVLPGVYREEVRLDWSGTAANPIRLEGQPQPGQPVVIEGTDDLSGAANWFSLGLGTWRASSVTWTPERVFYNGDTLQTWQGAGNPGTGSFKPDTTFGLLVNVGGANPGSGTILVGRSANGIIVLNERWLVIEGFEVVRSEDRGIRLSSGSSDVIVRNNTVRRAGRFGIQVIGSTNVTIASNQTYQNDDHGIALTAGTTQTLVEKNESWGNAVPNVRSANGIHLFDADRNVLRGNRVHDNQDTGMQFSMSDSNLCTQNVSWKNGDHGYDHLQATGNTHIGDVAWGNTVDGFSIEGNAVRQRLYNCIAVDNGALDDRYNLYVDSTSVTGLVSNDNIFWNLNGDPPIKHYGTAYATVASFSAATGQHTRTIQAEPKFVKPLGGDFQLLLSSPAIDSGNSGVPGWPATDAENRPRLDEPSVANTGLGPVSYSDRGAYEFVPAAFVDVPADSTSFASRLGVWPNPLHATGSFRFAISRAGPVTVDLLDVRGRQVRRLIDGVHHEAGAHSAPIEAIGSNREPLQAGVYFYRVESPDGPRAGKFLVVH